ncbi:hypothetical protein CEXT_438811 [Caerostris extrusa]|uniref:Uncharacterized protein n=1 Tax=Caerostris extrusa TaxID=172846 RepID=A0AAV4MB96_CAEEX|nr:hypothetical protein CEXT_438811 [Caerostris extrusa]
MQVQHSSQGTESRSHHPGGGWHPDEQATPPRDRPADRPRLLRHRQGPGGVSGDRDVQEHGVRGQEDIHHGLRVVF